MTPYVILFLVAAAAHLLPELVARELGHKVYAWETVAYGLEATALWCFVSVKAWQTVFRWLGASVSAYGVYESLQRSICRLAFPMDAPLRLPEGVFACNAAGYTPAGMSLLAVMIVATSVAIFADRQPTNLCR